MSVEQVKQEFKTSAMADVLTSRDEIIRLLELDGEFFIQFFLGEDLDYDVPKFHIETWEYLTNLEAKRVAVALPREHAKTTLSKLAAVWYLLFTEFSFIVYVSNTAPIAAEACKDIVNYMRSDNFRQVFGEIVFEIEQDGRGYYTFWIDKPLANGEFSRKFCILRAVGAGQQIRGLNIDNKRPDLAIVDDLEDDENTDTPALVLKLKKWVFGPFIKALSKKRHKIIWLGNMLSAESLLHHFCENSDQWHSLRFGAILSTGQPLWPDLWSFEALREDYLEYQKLGLVGRWFAEMMNMPISDEQALISAEDIYYTELILPDQAQATFITVDPAVSQKTWSDETAIAVHALHNDLWRTVEYVKGKFTPDAVFQLTRGLGMKWKTRTIGMETGAWQATYRFIFDVLGFVHNCHFQICEVPHMNRTKLERITAWCSLIRKKEWAITEGDYAITEQLLTYDPSKKANKDDLIDACAMVVTMT